MKKMQVLFKAFLAFFWKLHLGSMAQPFEYVFL